VVFNGACVCIARGSRQAELKRVASLHLCEIGTGNSEALDITFLMECFDQ